MYTRKGLTLCAALLLAAVVTCSALVACTAPESEEQLYYAPAPTTHGETQALVQWPLREAVLIFAIFPAGTPACIPA